MNCCKRFLKDETGAVTVDWVVLTAGVVVLAVLVMPPIRLAVVSMAEYIGETIDEYHGLLDSGTN
jgi:Flp pilus assembly pilin Flp